MNTTKKISTYEQFTKVGEYKYILVDNHKVFGIRTIMWSNNYNRLIKQKNFLIELDGYRWVKDNLSIFETTIKNYYN